MVAACVAPLWWARALPAADLPVHLCYARIIHDHADPGAVLHAPYQLATRAQPYFTVYSAMTALARVMPVVATARVLATLYVLALVASVILLARAAHPGEGRRHPPAAAFLVVPLLWNPVTAMGFLSFALALPLVVAAAALVLGSATRRSPARLLALTALAAATASLHLHAAACVILVALLAAAFQRTRPTLEAAAVATAASLLTLLLWRLGGEVGTGDLARVDWSDALRGAVGFEAVTDAFRIAWGTPPLKLTYAFYTFLGPWQPLGQLLTLLSAVALALVIRRTLPPTSPSSTSSSLRLALTLLALSFLLPWGIHRPSEFTFIDLRTMAVAAPLLVAALPARWFAAPPARLAVIAFALLSAAHLQQKFARFSSAAAPVLDLLPDVAPAEKMVFLSFDGSAPGWGRLFRVAHHLPFHHCAARGGLNAQLWDRYTDHLPVSYRPGHRPQGPSVWHPWELRREDLEGIPALLVQSPTADNQSRAVAGYPAAVSLIESSYRRERCDERWCLYRRLRP